MAANPPPIPDAEGVPRDKYVPRWGLLLICRSEEEHRQLYEQIKADYPDHELRAVSI